jgi:hypothetical protein
VRISCLVALVGTFTRFAAPPLQAADNATFVGEFREYSTIHSIGFEWDIVGDANHNATCQVHYRRKGTAQWKDALPLFRVDYNGWYFEKKADRAYNMFAGSLMFLEPGTDYEVRLDMVDPDGKGGESRQTTVTTRRVPRMPVDGRTLHVRPGAGAGDGSKAKPFGDLVFC